MEMFQWDKKIKNKLISACMLSKETENIPCLDLL